MAAEVVPTGPAANGEAAPPATDPTPVPAPNPRTAKLAAARAGLAKLAADEEAPPAPPAAATQAGSAVAAAAAETPSLPADKPAETKPAAEEPPDAQTAKGLEAIERRDRRSREQLAADRAAAKAELELERAELARLRAEVTGKAMSLDELKALVRKDPLEALKRLGLESEDDMEVVARKTYAVSKSGKVDPKNQTYAGQVARERDLAAQLEEIKRQQAELANEFKSRDQRAEMERFQSEYLDTAVKAIPAEPSFIRLAHTANPTKARAALLALGQRMERELGETPSHAEVIAQYEAHKKADLKDSGFTDEQIAAMLKPATAPAPAKAPPPKTLDVTARGTTPPINDRPTRDQKIAAARVGLQKLNAQAT